MAEVIQGQVIAHHLAGVVGGLAHGDGVVVHIGGVGVAQLEDVHLGALLQDGLAGVGAVGGVLGLQTGVGTDHDDVGAAADGVDALVHRVGQGLKGQLLHALLGAVPAGNVGGVHADDGHLDAAPLHNGVAGTGEIAAVGVLDVGRQHRHLGLSQDGFQGVNAEVEFMVS